MLNLYNNEIAKDILDYECKYLITNFGRIFSLKDNHNKDRILERKSSYDSNGYPSIGLYKNNILDTRLIHRLVAEAFIPNPNSYPEVNHIDGVKTNNVFTNLEWVTSSQNKQHAHRLGLYPPNTHILGVQRNPSSYIYVSYDVSRDRYCANVKIIGTRKNLQKNFSCKKYGHDLAIKLAAQAANDFLDSINDTIRPRNVII